MRPPPRAVLAWVLLGTVVRVSVAQSAEGLSDDIAMKAIVVESSFSGLEVRRQRPLLRAAHRAPPPQPPVPIGFSPRDSRARLHFGCLAVALPRQRLPDLGIRPASPDQLAAASTEWAQLTRALN